MQIKNKLLLLLVMLTCGISAAWAQQHVTVASTQNGTVSVDNASPAAGDVVTVTVTPAAGYQIAKSNIVVEATIDPGHAQAPGLKAEGPGVGFTIELQGDDPADLRDERTYTFTMPEAPYDVLITATFTGVTYFNVTVANAEHGGILADKTQAVEGETVNLTITPDTGYELDELYYMKGNDKVSIIGASFQMPAADVEVHATFKKTDYTITVGEIQNGTVEAPATAQFGDEVTVAVTPATGYELEALTYTVEGSDPVTIENGKFSMPAANVTINATFKKTDYTITVGETQNGTVEAPATAQFGDEVTVAVTPAEGYELEALTYTVEGSDPVPIENGKFSMPAANVTINATFKKTDYAITVGEIQNGTVEAPSTAQFGDEVTVTITPAEGYELESLTYTVEGSDPVPIENGKFIMPAANVTINATFKLKGFTITPETCENGSVTADKATATMGETVTLTATPAEGYEVDKFYYKVGETQTVLEGNTFEMPAADVLVGATFKLKEFTITPETCENGSVTADKTTATMGETVTLTATPDEGYEVDKFYYKVGETQTVLDGNTFVMPAADVVVGATFKKETYTVAGEPAALFGAENAWDINNANGEMTLGSDGLYTWTSEPTFLEGNVAFRVVKDNSWDVAYPSGNYNINNIKPGTYTLTVTLNPETGEVTATINGQADVYVFGEINGSTEFAPDQGVKMTSEDGKVYTSTVTIADTENGYSFFAFTHKLGDWNTANAYRFLAQSNGNFLVNGATMNVELAMAYNGDNSMKIPAGEYTLTVDLENMKLTITGGTQLSYILADGVEGVDYTVINDLAVVDRHMDSQQFFTSDGNENWITIKGGDFFADAILMDALKGGYVCGVFSDKNLNPYLTLTVAPIEGEDVDPVEPGVYSLANDFAPMVDEVIKVSKAYYNESENTLRAYAPGGAQGQSLTVDTSLFDYDFKNGYSYNVTGVINIKEPWAATSGKGLMDYVYPFQNYKILVLDADELAPPTAIDNITAEQGVESVRYYNAAGLESKVPFQGVNIVVKEMNDGSKVTTKIIVK